MFQFFPAVAALAILLNLSSAQTPVIIPPNLPACAQQCAILQQAQGGCLPPAAPVTNQGIYTSCFCQSNFLTTLVSGGAQAAGTTCPQCSPADAQTISTWFQQLCAAGGAGKPVITISITSSRARTSAPTAAATATANANADGGSTISSTSPSDNRGWMSTHWRWVLMLIILFIGFALLAFGASYLKRRYYRRRDAEFARSQPDLGSWGPGRSVHDFGAATVMPGPQLSEKGKGRERANVVAEQGQPLGNSTGSKRLKKNWLPGRK